MHALSANDQNEVAEAAAAAGPKLEGKYKKASLCEKFWKTALVALAVIAVIGASIATLGAASVVLGVAVAVVALAAGSAGINSINYSVNQKFLELQENNADISRPKSASNDEGLGVDNQSYNQW